MAKGKLQPGAVPTGWPNDVLQLIRELGKANFTLEDAYSLSDKLAALHPENKHIEDKIRQQLQVLRDAGLVEFVDNKGNYRLL